MPDKTFQRMLDEMPAGLDRATLRILAFHTGRSHALGRGGLLEQLRRVGFDVDERKVRQCIHDLRRAKYLICAAPGEDGGYYFAASLAEFREFCDRELHPKAIDMLETESAMKEAAREQFGEAFQAPLMP